MERRLAAADWLAGATFSIADISLYAYSHIAGDGGYDLAAFPAIGSWLERVAALPGHLPIDAR
jgi:glutathione S-transferase